MRRHVEDLPLGLVLRHQVKAARDQVAQQQNQQHAAAMAQQMAQGAQTLSQTDVGGGTNALAAMLGRSGGAQQ